MSKLDRWRKISAKNPDSVGSNIRPDKSKLLTELTTVPKLINPIDESNHNDEVESESKITEYKEESSVESRSIDHTPSIGVQEEKVEQKKSNKGKAKPSGNRRKEEKDTLIRRVNSNVESFILNKTTKEDTHKKTSFLIKYENLAKLEKFDEAHGGRIKGEFINTLLEEAFADLETDKQWNEILNSNLDVIIDKLKTKPKKTINNKPSSENV